MAYDRYDTREAPRDERSRWSVDRYENRDRGGRRDDRGFFERAGDEVASWFGDEDAERRRHEDRTMRGQREDGWGARDRSFSGRDYGRSFDPDRDKDRDYYQTRGLNERGGWTESEFNPSWRNEVSGGRYRNPDQGYRPMTGDYGRGRDDYESEQFFASSGVGRGDRAFRDYDRQNRFERDRSNSEWGRDPDRRSGRAGTSDWSDRSRHEDPQYGSWRQSHMNELDRDYDDYRRETQSRFEDDFVGWRERRQQKRSLLGQIREHMEVVGSDKEHVGTVDKIAGDRIFLTKSDPESGGVHHSLSCSDVDKIESDQVILDCSAEQARQRWRDERSSRALFERDNQGEMGPRMLNRSFEGTYRR